MGLPCMSDHRPTAQDSVQLGLDALILAVTEEVPRILTVRAPAGEIAIDIATAGAAWLDALPFGPLDPVADRTLERGVRRWVLEQTGLALGYVEQLYTFGDRDRDPQRGAAGSDAMRTVSVAYLALVHEVRPVAGLAAQWRDVYKFLPWEDWREGRPQVLDAVLAPALQGWAASADDDAVCLQRHERVEIAFGLGGAAWDAERVLERYELLYEVGLVQEANTGQAYSQAGTGESVRPAVANIGEITPADTSSAGESMPPDWSITGRAMALDHRRILATALGRLRGKLKYRPVVFELLSGSFTLLRLQRTVEALAGVRLHKANFRRLVEAGGLVEGTGEHEPQTGGRPAELFRFRREVLRERRAPGVGLPGRRGGP